MSDQVDGKDEFDWDASDKDFLESFGKNPPSHECCPCPKKWDCECPPPSQWCDRHFNGDQEIGWMSIQTFGGMAISEKNDQKQINPTGTHGRQALMEAVRRVVNDRFGDYDEIHISISGYRLPPK